MTERIEKLRQNDHRIQDTVWGYVRENNSDIPELIKNIIIKYYFCKQLSYNHLLLASEIFYLKELQCIKNYIATPLKENCLSFNDDEEMNIDDINRTFKQWDILLKFHKSFLNAITEQKHILPTLFKHINFTKLYIEYSTRYESMLETFSKWNSKKFKNFIIKQLENENVTKIIENNLCSLPWYLYRPFDRIKEYRRFVKDLQLLSQQNDEDYELINETKNQLSFAYKHIKKGMDCTFLLHIHRIVVIMYIYHMIYI